MVEVIKKSSRYFGGPTDIGEEDDRDTRAKGRVNPERKANCQSFRNGLRDVGNRTGMGNCVAAGSLEIGQTCGGRLKVGDKQKFVFQNAVGNRGRNGKSTNSHVMDPLKDRARLYPVGAAAQGMGQIHGVLKGPSIASPGEKNEWPTGRIFHTNPRFASKGRSEEKMGTETHSREKALEGEMSVGENRGFLESKSSQYQGCSNGYNKKQVTSRKERYTIKVFAGSEEEEEEEEEEEDEGRCYDASEQESFDGKIPEKAPSNVDMEVVGAKDGFLCVAADSSVSVLRGASQAGENIRCLFRNSEMITGDLRIEVEGEDDIRAGKRVGLGEVRLGISDGTRPESSGRERHFHREEQEETYPDPGQILGAGRGSGTERASGRELGRPNISNPVMGLFYRAALSPVSSIRALFNVMSLYEPSCSKVKVAVLEPGLCQDLLSKSVAKSVCFGSTFLSSEEGQKGNAINRGEGDEIGEIAVQEDGYSPMNRYDKNRYSQHSPISISVFGHPLLSGGFSGQGVSVPDKTLVPLRVEAADDRDWGSPGTIFDIGEGNGEVGQRKTKCNFELVENWKYGRWESSCLVKFSEFLGFPTKGFEKEIMNLLGKLVASQTRCKEKGSQSVSKSERELRRLRSTINYNGNKSNKGGGRDRGNLLLKLK